MTTNGKLTFNDGIEILKVIEGQNPSPEDIRKLIEGGSLVDMVQAAQANLLRPRGDLRTFLKLPLIEFDIVVNYDLSFEKMMALGRYDIVDENITPKLVSFELKGKVKRKIQFLRLDGMPTTREALDAIKLQKLVPARVEDHNAFNIEHPNIPAGRLNVPLGTQVLVDGKNKVFVFSKTREDKNKMYLETTADTWPRETWFSCVPPDQVI